MNRTKIIPCGLATVTNSGESTYPSTSRLYPFDNSLGKNKFDDESNHVTSQPAQITSQCVQDDLNSEHE